MWLNWWFWTNMKMNVGTLAPPMLAAKDSMDLIFSTHWVYPARIPVLQPMDKECIKKQIIRSGILTNIVIFVIKYIKIYQSLLSQFEQILCFANRFIRSFWVRSLRHYIKMSTAFTTSSKKGYSLWNSIELWAVCRKHGTNDSL